MADDNTAVLATASNASLGLYLPVDLAFFAMLKPETLQISVAKLHAQQPVTEDFGRWADRVGDTFLRWGSETDPAFGQVLMCVAALCDTHWQINRAMHAALGVAASIIQRSNNVADDNEYARVIPSELHAMHIASPDDLTGKVFQHILAVEPFISWTERLRAQQQRVGRVLEIPNLHEFVKDSLAGTHYRWRRNIYRDRRKRTALRHAARKSIRKSVKMFERLGTEAQLRTFLATAHEPNAPLLIFGKHYDYALKLRPGTLFEGTIACGTNLAAQTETAIYDKSGQLLCDVCVFFENTPVLDFVMALGLSVANAETELEVLRAACVITTYRAFFSDPLLPILKGLTEPHQAPMLINNVLHYLGSLRDEQAAQFEQIRVKSLVRVMHAFTAIMRPPQMYIHVLEQCAKHDKFNFLDGDETAISWLTVAQLVHSEGKF